MKIIYLANARIPTEKAHGIAIMRSCEAFARAGSAASLVVPRRRSSSPDAFAHYGVEKNFRLIFLPTLDLYDFVPDKLAFALQVSTFYVSAALWLLFQSRANLIYTREPFPLRFSMLGFRVAFECHRISRRRKAFFAAAKRAEKIIVISKALRDIFVSAGFIEKEILVAPSGVNLSVFDIETSKETARQELQLPLDAKIALYTGNFTTMGEDKGIGDIIEALKSAPEILFVAVGGSDEDIKRYEMKAREAGVQERVLLRGNAPQKRLALYQKAADVLLMPFPDTPHYRMHMSPVKMFEYMAADRPIIASDLPTIREVLNEQNALLVPPGDTRALALAMQLLFAQPELAARLSGRAHGDVAAYSWQERTRRVLQFLAV
ncbi:MAG TPA: glycosyltransferase [Candidatus Paceibacterota bacterium]|nr:glycosyltransferase [Candidatus Paceibacterota bacterium]